MLPTGTVTFLFTDIEGSTPLWETMPHEMQASLAQHHAILRQSTEANGGYVFQIVGDAFQVAFRLSIQGLVAALTAQRALQSTNWGATGPLKVRMGLHTGPAELDRSGNAPYEVSHTLNRAARVMSAGHGGQILLSQEAADLVMREMPEGVTLKDLGEHRLKGMQWLEHLFQICAPGLPQIFPPLATGIAHPHNLPTQLTSFVGREREIGEVAGLLEKQRLVTLTGSGGTGKTRLALRVAEQLLGQYPNGVWFVELASLGDPDLVPRTTIAALGMQESTSQSLMAQLQNYLKEKQLLLLLDNCEHILEDCARMTDILLRACPKLKILASSREALGVDGEITYRVPSLTTPDPRYLPPLEELGHFTAMQLFTERVASVQPAFAITSANARVVAQICRRLDGIPLAIELAAARVGVLSVEQIAGRLDSRFRLLTGGSRTALPRQQTLRASIDWSFSLLDEREQFLFMRLSVFYGGWTLDAANMVCSFEGLDEYDVIDGLTKLVNKSLIIVESESGGSNRYRMLETIRQYAREKLLDSGEAGVVLDHHLDFFVHIAETAEPHLRGPQQVEWLDRLEIEIDNVRAALEWALEEEALKGTILASSLYWMWHIRGYRVEAEHWLEQFFEKLSTKPLSPTVLPLLAKARVCQCFLQLATGRASSRTTHIVDEARALAVRLGEAGKSTQLNVLHAQAWNAYLNGQQTVGYELYLRGLKMAQALGDPFLIAEFLQNLTTNEPSLEKRKIYAEQNLALRQELGDLDGLATACIYFTILDIEGERLDHAQQMLDQALNLAIEVKNRWHIMMVHYGLGYVHWESGNFTQSTDHLHQALSTSMDYGEYVWTIIALNGLGHVAALRGDWVSAESYFLQAIENARTNHSVDWEVRSCIDVAEAAWSMADFALAERYYQLAEVAGQKSEGHFLNGLIAYGLGKAAFSRGDTHVAGRFFRQALQESMIQGLIHDVQFCLNALTALSASQLDQEARAARLGGAVAKMGWKLNEWDLTICFLTSFDLKPLLAPVRKILGDVAYERLYAEGQAMTLEQAVAFALEE
jgi:predicted ATPase/class 3 adenylate cyclase